VIGDSLYSKASSIVIVVKLVILTLFLILLETFPRRTRALVVWAATKLIDIPESADQPLRQRADPRLYYGGGADRRHLVRHLVAIAVDPDVGAAPHGPRRRRVCAGVAGMHDIDDYPTPSSQGCRVPIRLAAVLRQRRGPKVGRWRD
jgi:hypothetical protein